MLGGIERALHRTLASRTDSSHPPWLEPGQLTCAEWLTREGHSAGHHLATQRKTIFAPRAPTPNQKRRVAQTPAGPRATPGIARQ
ncbi:hypothetical protein BJA5080_02048 [Bradyrhizobium diazoefficiens SEMIA 5080]|uniref:Uncharacterized protein n=1 Tax=Bradyrhizobium diazoefficiens SEMIA 5080 TaxID=754504 RepID=A0A837C8A2_9BRAD|nr:hypothetical protein BJA5080_02048 [Bradyrhizobium diazoefficiens SEMIA 5080]